MRLYPIKTPNLIQRIFKDYIWRFSLNSTQEKTLFLTFDDGPTPEITEWTLNQLEKYNAKATFFCIGKNVVNHPDIYKKIIDSGHSIGNHTFNHLKGWKTKTEDYIENFLKAETIMDNTEKLFRPPYGKITPKQASAIKEKGYKIIMWDVLSADFDTTINPEECYKNVVENTKNGSIIVFHDSEKASTNLKYTLPKVLDYFSKKGYVFKRIAPQD